MTYRIASVVLVTLVAGCGSTSFLERFPVPAAWVCDEVTTLADTSTRRDRTEEACRVEGPRIVCETRSLTTGTALGTGEERIGDSGIFTYGNESTRYEPPPLAMPFDVAPGREWSVETTEIGLEGTPDAGSRRPVRKSYVAYASAECAGGLLIKSVRRGAEGDPFRIEGEALICPGASSPRSWTRKGYRDALWLWTVSGTCGPAAMP